MPHIFYYQANTCCFCLQGFIKASSKPTQAISTTDMIIDGSDTSLFRSVLVNNYILEHAQNISVHGIIIEDCFSPFVLLMLLDSLFLSAQWTFQHIYVSCSPLMSLDEPSSLHNESHKFSPVIQCSLKSLLFEGSECVRCKDSMNVIKDLNQAVEMALASACSVLQVRTL